MSENIEDGNTANSEDETKTYYYVVLNENNYFMGNWSLVGVLPNAVKVDSLPPTNATQKAKCYYLKDGTWILDEEKYNTLLSDNETKTQLCNTRRKIVDSKKELSNSDYKILKCAEEAIKKLLSIYPDLELPYDFEKLCEERQCERDNINNLEDYQ